MERDRRTTRRDRRTGSNNSVIIPVAPPVAACVLVGVVTAAFAIGRVTGGGGSSDQTGRRGDRSTAFSALATLGSAAILAWGLNGIGGAIGGAIDGGIDRVLAAAPSIRAGHEEDFRPRGPFPWSAFGQLGDFASSVRVGHPPSRVETPASQPRSASEHRPPASTAVVSRALSFCRDCGLVQHGIHAQGCHFGS